MRRITSITAGAAAVAAGLSPAIPGGATLAAHTAPPARPAARGGALPVIKVAMNGKKITVWGSRTRPPDLTWASTRLVRIR